MAKKEVGRFRRNRQSSLLGTLCVGLLDSRPRIAHDMIADGKESTCDGLLGIRGVQACNILRTGHL